MEGASPVRPPGVRLSAPSSRGACANRTPRLCLSRQGYLPANADRRPATLQRKQTEYFAFIERYYDSRNDEAHQDTFRQIHIDIPRMSPEALLLQPGVTEVRAGVRAPLRC